MQKFVLLAFLLATTMASVSQAIVNYNLTQLVSHVYARSVFKQGSGADRRCPGSIQLEKSESGIVGIMGSVQTFELKSTVGGSYFTYGQNKMNIVPNLIEGRTHNLKGDGKPTGRPSDILLRQLEKDNELTTYMYARADAAGKSKMAQSSITFDSGMKTITYELKAGGIKDVKCVFFK